MSEHLSLVDLEWKLRGVKSTSELLLLLKKYHSMLDARLWLLVFKSQYFSNKIFDEYTSEIPWRHIAMYRDIPEKYLEKFIEDVDYFEISAFLPLSLSFIKKYFYLLSIDQLIKNDKLNKEAHEYAIKLYEKVKGNPSFHRRWDNNLLENKVFTPKDFQGRYNDYDGTTPFPNQASLHKLKSKDAKKQNIIEMQEKTKTAESAEEPKEDYLGKSKAELKAILASRNVRTYYHDTLDILRKKCIDSEVRK